MGEPLRSEQQEIEFSKVVIVTLILQIRGLPTMVFVSPDTEKLAIRTEGLLSTNVIRDIIEKEL